MSVASLNTPKTQLKLLDAPPCYNQMTDAELVQACQKQNERAFAELVRRHRKHIYAMLYMLAPDWCNDINDLVQEVLIRVWRSIKTLKNPLAFRSWLNHITNNIFYDELRKRPKALCISIDQYCESESSNGINTLDIPDSSALPDELSEGNELKHAIHKAISRIPRQFRAAIVLREIEGLSYEEIAALTNSEIGTVKSRIARARTKIQSLLRPHLEFLGSSACNN